MTLCVVHLSSSCSTSWRFNYDRTGGHGDNICSCASQPMAFDYDEEMCKHDLRAAIGVRRMKGH